MPQERTKFATIGRRFMSYLVAFAKLAFFLALFMLVGGLALIGFYRGGAFRAGDFSSVLYLSFGTAFSLFLFVSMIAGCFFALRSLKGVFAQRSDDEK